ncbi:unnamed protein product [Pleuronectes platessa]|uniref:Phosphodiesterase n=1 Tax=Pleuronectes platessa TaxID=8262 RepID=A0A9N7YLF3_PLEPL|nr:unnamed protein product [Pleuronectes platessa]
MPCLQSEAQESLEPDRETPGTREESCRRETVPELPLSKDMGWFFSPLWSPRSKTRRFGDRMTRDRVEAWLDDHSDFTRAYFLRRASAVSVPQSPMVPTLPRSTSDHSDQLLKAHYGGASSPLPFSHTNISSVSDRLKTLACSTPDWKDPFSPDVLATHSPCSPGSSRFSFPPCRPLSPICPGSPDLSHAPSHLLRPTAANTAACGHGEGCPWMMELLTGGLSWIGSVAELCQRAVLHVRGILAAESSCLSLVKKDGGGRSTLVEVIAPTALECLGHVNIFSHNYLELLRGIMGCVLATGSPMNLKDTSEFPKFDLDEDQPSDVQIRTVLSVPIKNHRGEVVGVVVMINKRSFEDGHISAFTNMDEKVLSNHMDVLGMVLDNVQLYESSRQEAKRSQALIEMAQVLSKEHHSFEVLLSKMAATIMPFTHAQYCTIFIPREQTSVIEDEVKRSVCQLMNKCSRDSDDMEAFNKYDERLLEDLAVYCGLALQYAQAVQIKEERRASIEVTQEVLAYHITAAEQEIQALQEVSIPSAESLHILDFHFSHFALPEELSTQATVRMFLDLKLVQDFNIDYKSLCQWVLTVRRGYRNNVPYHNWNHALSTAQSMFAMLMATEQLQTIFSRLEILALMIATLNHDLDHRGVSNSYIERSQQPLAQLYGHSSLENHHYNLCLFILNNAGSQILSGLSTENHKTALHTIKRAILATNLTVYMERRDEFFSLAKKSRVSWKSEKQRELLGSMLMTASDLSAITKPWPEQKRIADLVAMEFFAQGDKEREEFKIEPIEIMNRENSTRLPYMQVEYIDEICYPLYKAVSGLFDNCTPLLSGCEKNRENWLHLAEEAEEENSEKCSEPGNSYTQWEETQPEE